MSRTTAADFNIYWKTGATKLPFQWRLLEPFIGDTVPSDWQIWDARDKATDHKYMRCAICPSKGALIVMSAALGNPAGTYRETEMRLWQMIVDGFGRLHNSLAALRFVVFRWIVNNKVRAAMFKEFRAADDKEALVVTVSEETAVAWRENWFVRCALRVGEAIAPGGSGGMKVHLDRDEATDEDDAELLVSLNMIVEFEQ